MYIAVRQRVGQAPLPVTSLSWLMVNIYTVYSKLTINIKNAVTIHHMYHQRTPEGGDQSTKGLPDLK